MAKKKTGDGSEAKTEAGGKRRARQAQLPALADKVDRELSDLAEHYVEVRDERMVLTKKEIERRDLLGLKLKERGLTSYTDPETGMVVTLDVTEKVKVKRPRDDEDAENAL